ncbi:MAG: hypothetical protein RI894_2642 [Bacteroidota bacterium]
MYYNRTLFCVCLLNKQNKSHISMTSIAKLYQNLTSSQQQGEMKADVYAFAKQLGWNPSYYFQSLQSEPVNGHLVVEHGLENAAIISFLNKRDEDLNHTERKQLLNLSYNNLVNWHITIDSRYITYYYVLNDKPEVDRKRIEVDNEENSMQVRMFEEIIAKRPNANIKALDDVLMDTIRKWKTWISDALNNDVSSSSLSTLFNCIILFRSIEDNKKRKGELSKQDKILLSSIAENQKLTTLITILEDKLGVSVPEFLLDKNLLAQFDNLDNEDVRRLFTAFYENDNNKFEYDFSVMTKHALSRIYEKYVAILSVPVAAQNALFSPLAQEKNNNKTTGTYYTPEYIARFFAKYLQENIAPSKFKTIKTLEPSVGSGIFLRTLLELQIEQIVSTNYNDNDTILALFDNVTGIDKDENACLATRLSLSLLYYLFANSLPTALDIQQGNSLLLLSDQKETYDAVISNPPYVNNNVMNEKEREDVRAALGGLDKKSVDLYLAFIKQTFDTLKPNGYGLFILPHNFLIAENAQKVRDYLLQNGTVKLVADLSLINVFEGVGVYNILLIVQKQTYDKSMWLMKCRSKVGEALNYVLRKQAYSDKKIEIYEYNNIFKKNTNWRVLAKDAISIEQKIENASPINRFITAHFGYKSDNDPLFIEEVTRRVKDIPLAEQVLLRKLLPDREMQPFTIPKEKTKSAFYPIIEGVRITEMEMRTQYSNLWAIIGSNNTKWNPAGLGSPDTMCLSKIVVPELCISPKFAIDVTGDILVSHSPYLVLNRTYRDDTDLLYYLLGILNSAPYFWYLTSITHKLRGGYSKMQAKVIEKTFIPDPQNDSNSTRLMVELVKQRIAAKANEQRDIERKIQLLAYQLYNLSDTEIDFFERNAY